MVESHNFQQPNRPNNGVNPPVGYPPPRQDHCCFCVISHFGHSGHAPGFGLHPGPESSTHSQGQPAGVIPGVSGQRDPPVTAAPNVVPPLPISWGLPTSEESERYKDYVRKAEADLQAYTPSSFESTTSTGPLRAVGSDIHNWRQPVWLIRDQLVMFGNLVPDLETMPLPHPGGFQWYAMYSRNNQKIWKHLKHFNLRAN